ncbi:unnamed protein product [Larinioides sclopetarius]|uniref:Protein kinase domain-containing protein n=1 Tax=Larinioides sclopetarius TaxID=280406 RepID=A0AAV2AQT3_9ARAC
MKLKLELSTGTYTTDKEDLKPSNIAVNEDCELKILDFGLARHAEVEMTGYVATRWYRAPEIMLNWMHYNQTVDIWSVGCIMAELLTSKTLFPGTDPMDQLIHIMSLVGTPDDHFLIKIMSEELTLIFPLKKNIDQLTRIMFLCGKPDEEFLEKINSEEARNYIRSLPAITKKNFKDVFSGAHPDAIDLLERMLELDADKRPTATEALAHPYLAQYADPSDEPIAEPYDESFEDKELSVEEWRRLAHKEVNMFEEPKIRLIHAGISEIAQDMQSRMILEQHVPVSKNR